MIICLRQSGPRFTIILKVNDYLNFKVEKIILRKTIFKLYSESQLLRNSVVTVHGFLIRRNCELDFDFISFYSHLKFSTLMLRCSLSLRNDCDPGP